MIIGVLKEIKADENRVALSPGGVEFLRQNGHLVLVEKNAGKPSGFNDGLYEKAGAEIVKRPESVFGRAEMILRVKEPQPSEYKFLKKGQIYFAYLHLAASEEVTRSMLDSGMIGIAYETIQKDNGSLPLLKPMSEVAGDMAIQQGAKYLEMAQGGQGVLLGGVPGVDPATVVILGGGVVGINAAKLASGLGAKVYILDIDLIRLRYLSDVMPGHCITLMSSPAAIREVLPKADVVVGAVLVPGSKTPALVTREMLKTMKKGSVLVDVSIDQGGCFETSKETTHADPTYTVDGIVHYAVSNMPGALPRTSTLALNNATLPYAVEIANKGWKNAMRENPEIKRGANVVEGKVTYKGVADAFGLKHVDIDKLI
ncbi:MAG: alanine dehydrogenase [Deltaproteobacteria bacterium]|jgi:alanine dehydrogenase|nr:alanine dehydrogenase [Deltaproteobacteria bacterium]MBW2487357.1 alanine dehydrogenase [Deltaproteobacteria bacterium]MBW2516124.1 alanine dehydrogenase [Deltaproteobacteria bacterium]